MEASSRYNNKTWETVDKKTPEQKLWIAVLGAAAEDAVSQQKLDCTGRWRNQNVIDSDRAYFLTPNRSFYQVCYFAGMDPEYIKRKMTKVLCQGK